MCGVFDVCISSRMRVLLILYCIIAVAESSGRSPLKRSRGSELPRIFEEEFEEAGDGVSEYKRRDTHDEDDSPTIPPAATYRLKLRLPNLPAYRRRHPPRSRYPQTTPRFSRMAISSLMRSGLNRSRNQHKRIRSKASPLRAHLDRLDDL